MLRFLADVNLNELIIRGVRRRNPEIEIVLARDVGLRRTDDPALLERAANEGWVVLTHDINTMIGYLYDRVQRGEPTSGLVVALQGRSLRDVIDVSAPCGNLGARRTSGRTRSSTSPFRAEAPPARHSPNRRGSF